MTEPHVAETASIKKITLLPYSSAKARFVHLLPLLPPHSHPYQTPGLNGNASDPFMHEYMSPHELRVEPLR